MRPNLSRGTNSQQRAGPRPQQHDIHGIDRRLNNLSIMLQRLRQKIRAVRLLSVPFTVAAAWPLITLSRHVVRKRRALTTGVPRSVDRESL